MDRLRFVFDLVDKASAPAGKASAALAKLEVTLKGAKGGTAELELGLAKAGGAAETATGKVSALSSVLSGLHGVALGVGAAIAAMVGPGALAGAGLYMAKTLAMRETTFESLKLMLGTEEAADRYFSKALAFAKVTPFATGEVLDSFKRIKAAGFSEQEAPIVFQALGDMASASGTGGEGIQRLVLAMSQIKGRGSLQMEEVNQIMEVAASGGLSRTALFEELAPLLGKGTKPTDVAAMVSAGKVSADVGIYGVLSAIRKLSGGSLGNQIVKQSTTLNGLWSTLASTAEDFVLSMDHRNLAGFGVIKGVVQNLTEVFNSASPAGERLRASIERAFNALATGIFGSLSGESGMEKLQAVMDGLVDTMEHTDWAGIWGKAEKAIGAVWFIVKSIWYAGEGIAAVFTKVGEIIAHMLNVLVAPLQFAINAVERMVELVGRVKDALFGGGESLSSAITNGLRAAFYGTEGIVTVGKGLGEGVIEGFSTVLGIHSPSRVFQELGEHTMEGYRQGLDAGAPEVAAPVMDMVRGGPSPRAAGGTTIHLGGVHVTLQGGTGQDAEGLAARLADLVYERVASAFEQAALEAGA